MILWRVSIACWTPKATNTRSQFVNFYFSTAAVFYSNAPHCYLIRTLPVLFIGEKRAELLKGICKL